jgi:hypothetical protein
MFVASAIFSDRMIVCDEHFPIVSYREGSENRYCTKPLRGRRAARPRACSLHLEVQQVRLSSVATSINRNPVSTGFLVGCEAISDLSGKSVAMGQGPTLNGLRAIQKAMPPSCFCLSKSKPSMSFFFTSLSVQSVRKAFSAS